MLANITPDTNKPRSLFDLFFVKNPTNVPDNAPIFTSEEKSLTFGELSILIRKCAYNLKEKYGIQKGDVVAIRANPHIDYVVMMHSVDCAGGSVALVNNFSVDTPDTIAHDLEIVTPKLFITDYEGSNISLTAAAKAGIPVSRILVIGDTGLESIKNVQDELFVGENLAEPCTYTPEEYDNLCIYIIYTSGSTGRKKAVIYTPRTMLYPFKSEYYTQEQKGRILTYQQFHIGSIAFCEICLPIFFGYQVYIKQLNTNDEICQAIEKYKIATLLAAPYVLIRMVKEQSTKKYDLSSLTSLSCVGAILHQKIIQDANEMFGPIIVNAYGATEAYSCLLTTPTLSKMGAVGRIASNHSFRLVDENNNEVKQGDPGELLVKGPTVTIGYYKNPEATAKAFTEDGYYRTGDVLKCDSDGIFWFFSRSKNLIKYRSSHIYPSEIEEVVLRHPKVSDCGVIGVFSQEIFEELPRAYVTLVDEKAYENKDVIAREILEFTNKQLPEIKQIRAGVIVKKTFERTPGGKILYPVLKEEAEKEQYALEKN